MDVPVEQRLRAYVEYFRDLGVEDFYRREPPQMAAPGWLREWMAAGAANAANAANLTPRVAVQMPPLTKAPLPSLKTSPTSPKTSPPSPKTLPPSEPSHPSSGLSYFGGGFSQELRAPMPKPVAFDALAPLPAETIPAGERAAALEAVREEIGDCTRCPLAYAGRHTIVFGEGDANARLMFVGEGPGADEDAQGRPFVGRAGQLLNNMIAAMGLRREEVYIANVVKCRPPGNRTPEFVEASTCSQFLVKQIDIVRPEVIVALGATAATYLLGVRQSLSSLRGRWHSARGAKVAVTYHPAFLLRDPRQKGEAWKDLQRVMAELGLKAAPRKT